MGTRAVVVTATGLALVVLGGCAVGSGNGTPPTSPTPQDTPSTSATPSTTPTRPPAQASGRESPRYGRGLVYYVGHRARTGEARLFAEQTDLEGRADLLAAVGGAMSVPPADPDYVSVWDGGMVERVKLWWDGDEGYYAVHLRADSTTGRPSGMSMREAHLAIQQVVWTLGSVGRVAAPVRFVVGRSAEPVTDLWGIPATGRDGTYVAASYDGVLSRVNVLTPADRSVVDGVVEVSGLAESHEATVGIRVTSSTGEVVHDYSTSAEQCCGRLWPWVYAVDTSGWAPGAYVVEARTDDPIGIAQGSDGPEIDTRTIVVE